MTPIDHEAALEWASGLLSEAYAENGIKNLARAYLDLRNTPIAKYHFDQAAELALLRRVAEEAESVAHGFDETCGKYPELEKALAAWREGVKV